MSEFSSKRRTLLSAASVIALAPLLSACGEPEFIGSDITGTGLGKGMAMVDSATGQPRTLADYQGKVVVVFFGFTQCPDVCPTSLAELSQTMELLGSDASKVQVVMISVDPERDTPDILSAYVSAFHPDFAGLTGSPEQLSATAQSFKTFYSKIPGETPGDYSMSHGASFYLIDTKGEARVLASDKTPAKDLAHDIKQLL